MIRIGSSIRRSTALTRSRVSRAIGARRSPDNEYGPIRSHKIALAGRYGNGLLVAVLINGRKSDAVDLDYDPKSGQLSFAPPGVSLYLGP